MFKEAWENAEILNLTADRDKKIFNLQKDIQSEVDNNLAILENVEKTVEEAINLRPTEDFIDDDHRDLEFA